MATSSNNLPTFEKLQGESNYDTWKFQMELSLIHDGLWKYTKDTPDSDELEIQQDQLTRAKIGLMVENDCLIYIKETTNAREAWEALKKAFEGSAANSKGQLLNKLLNMKLDQFGSIKQYVSAIMSTANQLKVIGAEVDDELLATILLQGLTEDYDFVRISIEKYKKPLTTDYVRTKLLHLEDQDITFMKNTADDDEDFYLVPSPIQRQRKTLRDKQERCLMCNTHRDTVTSRQRDNIQSILSSRYPSSSFSRIQYSSNTDCFMDSGDYAYMTSRRDYPCFVAFARLCMCCIVKIFKLW